MFVLYVLALCCERIQTPVISVFFVVLVLITLQAEAPWSPLLAGYVLIKKRLGH